MRGEKIERVDERHLGRAIVSEGMEERIVVPVKIIDTELFCGFSPTSGGMADFWIRESGRAPWHYWLPDPKPEERKPSQRIGEWGSRSSDLMFEDHMKILDEHHDRLKKLELLALSDEIYSGLRKIQEGEK